jgi:DNA-binding response OmpR family regulator
MALYVMSRPLFTLISVPVPERPPVGELSVVAKATIWPWSAPQFDGSPVALTPKEHDLLVYLAGDPGAVFSRKQLIEDVWDQNWWGSTKTLDVHVASLRKKLAPELIETVRGVGFRLAEAAEAP